MWYSIWPQIERYLYIFDSYIGHSNFYRSRGIRSPAIHRIGLLVSNNVLEFGLDLGI